MIRITVTLEGRKWAHVVAAVRAATKWNQRLYPHPYSAKLGYRRAASIERQATEHADDQAATRRIPVTLEYEEWLIVAGEVRGEASGKVTHRLADAIYTQVTEAADAAETA